MSLLPLDAISIPGVIVAATCVPAREVGGDYYEFVRLGDRRLGILVADVSGKGISAALYMAELKGLFLSLSRIYESPRELLIKVNRLITDHIDSRSFITMTYAVLDMDRETLTYVRGGHTPLVCMRGEGDRHGRGCADTERLSGWSGRFPVTLRTLDRGGVAPRGSWRHRGALYGWGLGSNE